MVLDVGDESVDTGLEDGVSGCDVSSVQLVRDQRSSLERSFQSRLPKVLSFDLSADCYRLDIVSHDRVLPHLSDPVLDMRHNVRLQYTCSVRICRFADV